MFPSQRGNFFKNHHVSTDVKGTRSSVSQRSRPKSPPLGASAIDNKLSASTFANQNPKLSPQSTEGERSSLSVPVTLPTPDVTLSKYSHISSFSKPRIVPSHGLSHASNEMPSLSQTPPTTDTGKSNPDPYLSMFSSSVQTPKELLMSRIPSTWSNQQWSLSDPFYQYNLRQGLNIASISSNSKLLCESKNGPCGKLPAKTQQERLMIKKLCDDAMKHRRDVFAFYSNLHEEETSKSDLRLSQFDPKNHKGRLCDFMLKLVSERQQLLDNRRQPFVIPRKSVLNDDDLEKPRYTPVYCVKGKTILGKPSDSISFPNSFAHLIDLRDPKEDPLGYRRFCTLVNMKGFRDNEIFLRITGSCLTIDGVHLTKPENQKYATGARVMSVYVELPKGVYPDYLKIGRSTDGVLVIQEPWKF